MSVCLCAQVSTEYSSFKRDAEVKLEELEHERNQAREELQLAMVAGSVSHTRHVACSLCCQIYVLLSATRIQWVQHCH